MTPTAPYLFTHPEIPQAYPIARPQSDSPEYAYLIAHHLPMVRPPLEPAQLCYSPQTGYNEPVCQVRHPAWASEWHISIPGLGGPACNFQPARADKPTRRYERDGHCWTCIAVDPPAIGEKALGPQS